MSLQNICSRASGAPMFEKVKHYLDNRKRSKRPFIAFQVEPTSRCQLKCVMCPRTAFSHTWESGDMPLTAFNKISNYFHLTQDVHLQGWGEPLLHPGLFAMIRSAKQENCRVSLTTNGALLTRDVSQKLLNDGVDIVALSIAGATRETHENIRRGSHFGQLLENIRTLAELKKERQSKTPKLVLSFLMTKTNIHELPEAVDLAKAAGIDDLVATNLDYVSTPLQDKLRAFSCNQADATFAGYLETARSKAAAAKLPFRRYPLELEEVVMCELNPLAIAYFSHDGSVSPCVYLNLSKQGPIPRIFCDSRHETERLTFGNISANTFREIWDRAEYQSFRMAYRKRIDLVRKCSSHLSVESMHSGQLTAFENEMDQALSENPVPGPCKTCYKAYGI